MQGNWNVYGQQPTAFNQSWHLMWNTISAIAPGTIFVWAPNTPQGSVHFISVTMRGGRIYELNNVALRCRFSLICRYPYGETLAGLSRADVALLDTNADGQLSAADNALDPYYPGDAVVDWIGLSLCTSSTFLDFLFYSVQ